MNRQRNPHRFSLLVKILVGIVVLVAVAFCLAWVWHTTQQSAVEESSAAAEQSEPQQSEPESSQEEPESSPEESTPDEESLPAGESETPEGVVPTSQPVGNEYFDDAIFIGDSVSTGISLYQMAGNAQVVAMTGINLDNISTKPVIDLGGEERVTILEACESYGPKKKVYILLGGNSLGSSKEAFIQRYEEFLTSVKALYPDSIIYLQSMTPVVEGYKNQFDPEMDNDKINAYNQEIMGLARRSGVYYLDVGSALKDENGNLPTDASPTDGLHFKPEYYAKWFEYLKTHTVEVKG